MRWAPRGQVGCLESFSDWIKKNYIKKMISSPLLKAKLCPCVSKLYESLSHVARSQCLMDTVIPSHSPQCTNIQFQ